MNNPFAENILHRPEHYREEWDVSSINPQVTQQLTQDIDGVRGTKVTTADRRIPVLIGSPGLGKTHLFGRISHHFKGEVLLVFVPQIEDIKRPLDHIRWHMIETLFEEKAERKWTRIEEILAKLFHKSFREYFSWLPQTIRADFHQLEARLTGDPLASLEIVQGVKQVKPFQLLAGSMVQRFGHLRGDVVRAIALGWSPIQDKARRWLRGESISEDDLTLLDIDQSHPAPEPLEVLKTVATLLTDLFPIVVCCDQLEGVLEHAELIKATANTFVEILQKVPNTALVLSCHKDRWKQFQSEDMFVQRTKIYRLNDPTEEQLLELIARRLRSWSDPRRQNDEHWPFDVSSLKETIAKNTPAPRGLLQECARAFDQWLEKCKNGSEELIYLDGRPNQSADQLFRAEWEQELAKIDQDDKRSPKNTQAPRVRRAIREALELIRHSGNGSYQSTRVEKIEDITLSSGAAQCEGLLLSRRGAKTQPLLICICKIQSSRSFSAFLAALEKAMDKHQAEAILVHHARNLPLGKTKGTIAREIFDRLVQGQRLKAFPLVDNLDSFKLLECYLQFRDYFPTPGITWQLGNQALQLEDLQALVIKAIGFIDKLKLFKLIFPEVPVVQEPSRAATPAKPVSPRMMSMRGRANQPPMASDPAQPISPTDPRDQSTRNQADGQPAAAPAPQSTQTATPVIPTTQVGAAEQWANVLLHEVVEELARFNCEVLPIKVESGARFARLLVRTKGRTTIDHLRRKAEDLKTRLPKITTTPLIDSQSEGISIDVQLPKEHHRAVTLNELFPAIQSKPVDLPLFPVGQDVAGNGYWADLSDPNSAHYLVAGTTGSGKSEFLKALLTGMARRQDPTRLQFILIDPKLVTFNFDGNSPYFHSPLVHTAEEAVPLLQWCFQETDRRYEAMAARRFSDLSVWLQADPNAPPRIVVICDEFPDLVADEELKKELEKPLSRLSAKARAAGIHLVLAAQRPEARVVTPQLRSCLPGRVCLRVSSAADSKIVLDKPDAADLLGQGDLLWSSGPEKLRLQAPLVTTEELEAALRIH